MHRFVPAVIVTIAASLTFLPSNPARAIGVYEDAVGHAGFLLAPHQPSLRSAFIRTAADDAREASMFVAAGAYPVRHNLLIQIEQPYIAIIGEPDIESGFGDTHVRARLRLYGGDGRALQMLGGLRIGSGSTIYYPYSSQSYDMELGFGYVDSLGTVTVWGLASGVAVKREPEGLPEASRHQNFARGNAGVAVALGSRLVARAGASALLFRSGSLRDIYFGQVEYRHSRGIALRASIHAEAGDEQERISDLAVTASILSFF
jgi:hypothetical protein